MLLLLITYYAQGVLYTSGGVVGQIILMLLFIFSLLYFFVVLLFTREKLPFFVKAWTALLLLNVTGFFLSGEYGIENISILKSILLNLLPFYGFYYFAKKGILTKNHLIVVLVALIPICVVTFIQSNLQLREIKNKEEVVDNTVYLFLGLIPFIFLFKRKIFAIITLIILWIFLVQSAKRAAIICGIIGMLFFFYYQLKLTNKQNLIRNYLVGFILISGLSYWGYRSFTENEFLISRLNQMIEGDTSGRDVLSQSIFTTWLESNSLPVYFFGMGFNTSKDITIHVSHNDWLEMLAGFGLFGFCIYLSIFAGALRELRKKDWVLNKKLIFTCIILIGLITSLTSRWYWASFAYSQCLLLPYILATRKYEN